MTDINIASLPDAGAFDDADIFHLSQTGSDKKTVLSDLDQRFSKVDIYGLIETVIPTTDMFVAVGVDGTIENNKKVSLENIGELVQDDSLFADDDDVDSSDAVPFRKDGAATLSQCTVSALAKRVMSFPDLPNSLTAATVVDTDYGVIYDTSATVPKKINIAEYRQSMLNPATLSALASPANADVLYLYDDSATEAKKITYSNLFDAITNSLPFDDRLSSTSADTANGLIDFAAGIKTNTIVPSSGTDITVTAKLIVNSEIASALGNFTNVKGKVLGAYGNSSSLYITSVASGSKFTIKANEFTPIDDNTTDLGTLSLKYKALYTNTVDTAALTASTSAALPVSSTIHNGVGQTAILTAGKFNNVLLPASTETSIGAIELSTLAELQANSPSALSQAITAGLLAQCVTSSVNVISGETVYSWSFKIGGLLINVGRWMITTFQTTPSKIVSFGALDLPEFADGNYAIITDASPGGYNVSAYTSVSETGFTMNCGFISGGGGVTSMSFIAIGNA